MRVKIFSSPRSGSHWLSYMLQKNYGVVTATTAAEKHFFVRDEHYGPDTATVCLVRHPIDWAVSHHRFAQSIGNAPAHTTRSFFCRMLPIYAAEWSVFNRYNLDDCHYSLRYEDLLEGSEEVCERMAGAIGMKRRTDSWVSTDRHMSTYTTPEKEPFDAASLKANRHLVWYEPGAIDMFWNLLDQNVIRRCGYQKKGK